MKNDVNGAVELGSIDVDSVGLSIEVDSPLEYDGFSGRNLTAEDSFNQQILALCLLALSAW